MRRHFLRLWLWLWLALAGLQVALGATWVARNLDNIPDYGDTADYIQLARKLKVDAYRGIAYPALIAGLDRVPGSLGLVRRPGRDTGSEWQAGVLYLQAIQCLVALAALTYFARSLLAPAARAGPPGVGLGLLFTLLLFLDPLVAHFGLSIMTDSLALSGSLVYCAALAAFGLGTSRRRIHGVLLLAAYLLTAALRPEKVWVLGCATLATLATWLWLERRSTPETRRLARGRSLQVLALAALASATVYGLQRNAEEDGRRWPVYDSIVHARIVFPNVTRVYDQLSQKTRARISPAEARKHDLNPVVGYRIINDSTGGSGPIRKKDREEFGRTGKRPSVEADRTEMLADIAGVVLRERWAPLVLDILKDAVENVAATFSFYVRLGLLARTGDVSPADGTEKTYDVLSALHPESSRRYVVSSVVLVLASTVLAGGALLRRTRGRAPPIARGRWLQWVPVGTFVFVNACAFALRADMVHIRYMLLAHTAFVALVLRGALDWLLGQRGATPGAVTPVDPSAHSQT